MKRYLIAATLMAVFSFPAHAEFYPENWTVACAADANELRDELANKYGESQMMSTNSDNVAFELWTNSETETWTVMFIRPTGDACVVAASVGEWLRNPGI